MNLGDENLEHAWSKRLLAWQAKHGRKGLPWQETRDPYRVWLSEIMLQQTQVVTVIEYYQKFLKRFPNVGALAAANQNEVMSLWAGLGYYSRARNLHACAQKIMADFGGEFPKTAKELETLAGIGRSTAAAVASFCFSERVAILDGNVKRVLARVRAFNLDLSLSKNERILWQLAQNLLPEKSLSTQMPRYTQAMMDLGATVCTPRKPRCEVCPMQSLCQAFEQGKVENFPVKSKKLKRKSISYWLLLARNHLGQVYLQRRPTPGIWAGLHCLPLFESEADLLENLSLAQQKRCKHHAPFLHLLTHRDLHLHIVELTWGMAQNSEFNHLPGQWTADFSSVGLPAPLSKFLNP